MLQIEAPETIRLVEELSRRTGRSVESVVDTAVRKKLARLRTPEEEERRRSRIYEGVRALQEAFKKYPEAMVDHAELLYGEDGMPKRSSIPRRS